MSKLKFKIILLFQLLLLIYLAWYQIEWQNYGSQLFKGLSIQDESFLLEKYSFENLSRHQPKEFNNDYMNNHIEAAATKTISSKPIIHVVVIVCGGRKILSQSVNLIKTTVIFATNRVKFTLFIENKTRDVISREVNSWPNRIRDKLDVEFRATDYPKGYEKWRHMYAQCSTLRLFLPMILSDVDSVIYIDADSLFLSDITALWRIFDKFDEHQLFACANETDVFARHNWYQRHSVRFPFYGSFGFNAGILLMNLTRMRQFGFIDKIARIYDVYEHDIKLADQDLLNILAFYNPEITYSLDCSWNFRAIHCLKNFICVQAAKTGPKLLHGNSGLFDKTKRRLFTDQSLDAIYDWFNLFNFTTSYVDLMSKIEYSIKRSPHKFCSKFKFQLVRPFVEFRLTKLNYKVLNKLVNQNRLKT